MKYVEDLESGRGCAVSLAREDHCLASRVLALRFTCPADVAPPTGTCHSRAEECVRVLLRCCFILHTPAPLTALHNTANHWLQQVLCYFLLGPDITDAFIGCLLDFSHMLFRQQHLEQLVIVLANELTSTTQRISTQHLSLISLPILSLPAAVPLVEALLLNGRADGLNTAFLEATTCAISKGQLAVRPPVLHSLWLSHLPALEGTLLCCLEGTLIGPNGPQLSTMQQKICETGLAEACALHSEIFEAVMLFLRSLMGDSLNSPLVSYFIRIFTRDFVKAAGRLEVSATSPWRSLLPTCLHPLLPLCLTRIEDVQAGSWSHHCVALAAIFQQASESVANSPQVHSNLPLMMAAIGDWLDMSLWLCVLPPASSLPSTFADLASLSSSTADKIMVKTMLVQASQKLRGFLYTDQAASMKLIEALCPLRVFCPDLAARLVTLSLLSTSGGLDFATSLWKGLEPSPAMADHAASILDFAERVLSTSFCNDIYPSWLPTQSSTSKDSSVIIPKHLYHILGFSSDSSSLSC
uniref:Fanconi anemia group C protein isoform X2 n=1 Tax=Myxine glutinosa TaxID=7769 RepID=UPI00358E9773